MLGIFVTIFQFLSFGIEMLGKIAPMCINFGNINVLTMHIFPKMRSDSDISNF